MDKNYVIVGNIIEQERLRRQAQISKSIINEVYDHIEKAHNDDLNYNIEKSDNLMRFETDIQDLNKAETELLLHKIQRQLNADSESTLLKAMKSIAINHYNDIEKARSGVYEDTAENRKLGRVGQQYGGKKDDGSKSKGKTVKQVYDDDFNDDFSYVLSNFTPFAAAPKVAGGMKVGTVNDKGEIWMPTHNKDNDGYKGEWVTKEEIEKRADSHRSFNRNHKLTAEQKKNFPIGSKWVDKKGREFIVKKQDSYAGKIKLVHETADGKKKAVYFTGYELRPGLNKNLTTGFPEIDKILRGKSGIKKAEENDIEKAAHGIYEDNAENRRLNRVGQEYGHAAQQKEPTNKQPKNQEEGGGIQAHAAKASDEALKRAAADKNAKPEVREAAKKELANRGGNDDKQEKPLTTTEKYEATSLARKMVGNEYRKAMKMSDIFEKMEDFSDAQVSHFAIAAVMHGLNADGADERNEYLRGAKEAMRYLKHSRKNDSSMSDYLNTAFDGYSVGGSLDDDKKKELDEFVDSANYMKKSGLEKQLDDATPEELKYIMVRAIEDKISSSKSGNMEGINHIIQEGIHKVKENNDLGDDYVISWNMLLD